MATSPTPSLDSIRGGTNSIESYIEHNGYLSDSPLTLSGSSPPASDSAMCDDFSSVVGQTVVGGQHTISASVSSSASSTSSASSSASSASSTSSLSSSGLSGCGSTSSSASSTASNSGGGNGGGSGSGGGSGPGVIGSGKGSPCQTLLGNNSNVINVTTANGTGAAPRCTACKSKQSDAVAKCFDCISFLCGNCCTAHEFMHCFNGHNVCLIKGFESGATTQANNNSQMNMDFKFSSSLTMMLQQQQQQQQQQHQQQQQSAVTAGATYHQNQQQNNNSGANDSILKALHQQQPQQQPLSQLSKIVLSSAAAAAAAAAAATSYNNHDMNSPDASSVLGQDDIFSSMLPSSLRNSQHQQQQQQLLQATLQSQQSLLCQRHKNEVLKFSCRTCCTLVCKECVVQEHSSGMHEVEHVQENGLGSLNNMIGAQQTTPETVLQTVLADLRGKVGEIVSLIGSNNTPGDNQILNGSKIKLQYQKAHNEVNETYQFFCSMLDERKQELMKELEGLYNAKMATHSAWIQRSKDLIEKTLQSCDAIERSPKAHTITEVLMLRKTLELQLQAAMQELQMHFELEFMSNYQSIQAGVRNTFGYIRASAGDMMQQQTKQPPIARPSQSTSSSSSHGGGSSNSSVTGGSHLPGGLGLSAQLLESSYSNALLGTRNHLQSTHGSAFDDLMAKRFNSASSTQAASAFVGVPVNNPYEKWSNGGSDNIFSSNASDPFSTTATPTQMLTNSLANGSACTTVATTNGLPTSALTALNMTNGSGCSSSDSIMDLTSKLLSASIYPPKSQIKRQKMIYHCKFGEFGVMEGQFTEPSGVAVNAQNDIIVADTNNHRIQIFDKEGRFKFQFGECGKRDSQLLYPNRVAVVRNSGDIIVTERSPTHQIQIYNQYGQFVRKFGANILQHPRGVTVDNKGRIIVVECKVMRVIIFDQNGNVLHKFGCSKHLEFPNGVVVNDKQEIFISDNRAHCVKVFNYEGQYLRQIGGEGVTNYPIGVGINTNGEILIADNHNNFNLTIFTQDGQLVSALESKVKHAQCFDVALMDDGSVVLASKDYRLYIYRYVQVPPLGL
ncbi:tripartite motif-containing protein brain tumor isoform X2 [Haematobia irritans]|uniref:tripartite motif-containing protein brain tumor isoform X2 n=1 Tax=Haematobia irritans TaxID=7368 RepID=UPI003F4FFE8A